MPWIHVVNHISTCWTKMTVLKCLSWTGDAKQTQKRLLWPKVLAFKMQVWKRRAKIIWMKMPPVLVGHCHNQSFGSFAMQFVMLCQASHLFILILFYCIRYQCLLACSCNIEHLCFYHHIWPNPPHTYVVSYSSIFTTGWGIKYLSLEICLFLPSITHQNCELFICFCVFFLLKT